MDPIRRREPAIAVAARPAGSRSPGRVRSCLSTLAIAGMVAVIPDPVAAQEAGTLKGVVSTSDHKPLAQARIAIVGTVLVAVADSDGSFHIAALPIGSQQVEVKLLGFTSVLLPVEIQADKPATLSVILTPVALPLETVTVSADTFAIPAMRGYLERRSRGAGKFFNREEIEKMHARLFTDILRRVPGMQIQSVTGNSSSGYTVRSGRNGESVGAGRNCPVLFYMNGMPFPTGLDGVNSYISPEEVEAVEVYTGASELPAQFNATAYNARCGVVLIWTLNGSDSKKKH